jgi:hypothetical protein
MACALVKQGMYASESIGEWVRGTILIHPEKLCWRDISAYLPEVHTSTHCQPVRIPLNKRF